MKKIPKRETVVVTVAPGAVAGTAIENGTPNPYKPDRDYSKVVGVHVALSNPLGDATADFIFCGVNDSTKGVLLDDSPFELFSASSAVAPKDKFTPLNVPCDGRTLKSRVTPQANAVQGFSVVFTYLLEDEDVEIARV